MNIPQLDQDLATIKATKIQLDNAYHLSKNDYMDFLEAVHRIYELQQQVAERIVREFK